MSSCRATNGKRSKVSLVINLDVEADHVGAERLAAAHRAAEDAAARALLGDEPAGRAMTLPGRMKITYPRGGRAR